IAAPERRTMAVACCAHVLHDGYTDLLYVLLPLWQAEFGLGYAEVGLLRSLFPGAMAGFQMPAGPVAEPNGGPPLPGPGPAAAAAILAMRGLPGRNGRTEIAQAVPSTAEAAPNRRGFPLLLAIAMIDSATRMGFLTFLPFLLQMKGADLPTIGVGLTLVFTG